MEENNSQWVRNVICVVCFVLWGVFLFSYEILIWVFVHRIEIIKHWIDNKHNNVEEREKTQLCEPLLKTRQWNWECTEKREQQTQTHKHLIQFGWLIKLRISTSRLSNVSTFCHDKEWCESNDQSIQRRGVTTFKCEERDWDWDEEFSVICRCSVRAHAWWQHLFHWEGLYRGTQLQTFLNISRLWHTQT
jgi:hypothetical protein